MPLRHQPVTLLAQLLEVHMHILQKVLNALRYGTWTDCQHPLWEVYIDRYYYNFLHWRCRSCRASK